MSSIRVDLALTASLDLELEQLDVQTAFLHGDGRDLHRWHNQKEAKGKVGLQTEEDSLRAKLLECL